MASSGGALTRGRIAIGCIALLGVTLGTGLTYTEISQSGVSSLFGKISDWLGELFNDGDGASSSAPSSTAQPPWDPIYYITMASSLVWEQGALKFVEFISQVYEWLQVSDNRQSIVIFFKNLNTHVFWKELVFNLPWTIRSWLGVLVDRSMLVKFPKALEKAFFLSRWFALLQDRKGVFGQAKMVNWLYLRFFINPRRSLKIFTRGNGKPKLEGVKCDENSRGKRGKPSPTLGTCFIFFIGSSNTHWGLRNDIANFLIEGKTPATEKE